MNVCQHCQGPLSKRHRHDARYCNKRECQLVSQKAKRLEHLVLMHCRGCGDPIGYGNKVWCNKPECLEKKKDAAIKRRHELAAMDRNPEARSKRKWNKHSKKEPTGRECQKCHKEIYRLRDEDGLVTFDSYFHCHACNWPKEDEVMNEEFLHVG